ncbi:hypothetical protein JCM5350_000220, partial [Sporobolomyces pararoseus]
MDSEALKIPWHQFNNALASTISALADLPLHSDEKSFLSTQLSAVQAYTASKRPTNLPKNSTDPLNELSTLDASSFPSINNSLPSRPFSWAEVAAHNAHRAAPPIDRLPLKQPFPAATGSNSIQLPSKPPPLSPLTSLPIDKYACQIVLNYSTLPSDSPLRTMDPQTLSKKIYSSFAKVEVSLLRWQTLKTSRDLLLIFLSPSDASLARQQRNLWIPLLDSSNSLQIRTPLRAHAIVVHRVPKVITEVEFSECMEDIAGGVVVKVETLPERRVGSVFGSRKVVFRDIDSTRTCLKVGEVKRFGGSIRFEEWDTEKIRQCWYCAGLGHFKDACKAKGPTCRECAGDHQTELCTSLEKK